MKNLVELISLSSKKLSEAKLYLEDPYGSGINPEPVRSGDVIINDDGDEFTFCGISIDGKMIRLKKGGKGEELLKKPSFVSGVIKEGEQEKSALVLEGKQDRVVQRIAGEVMAVIHRELGKNVNPKIKEAVYNGVADAYDSGLDDGFEQASDA